MTERPGLGYWVIGTLMGSGPSRLGTVHCTAPAAWTLDYFRRKYGEDLAKNRPVRGWDTVTVPGAVAL